MCIRDSYYHFDSKEALGYAIVEEIIAKLVRDGWLRPLLSDGQPIDILIGIVRRIPARPEDIRAGCPLLNLAQEMSPLDEQFRKRLERIFLSWQEGVATLLRKGQSQGTVRRNLNPDEAASFLIAMVEGCLLYTSEVRVQRASHHLALVVDAGGETDSISLRKHDTCDCAVFAVQPNPTNGC